jgi:glutamyl-Q tRNA(Asp) synthetase
MGSLLTAVASYLDARAANGTWSVRIEDLDTPRVVPGAADGILRTLEAHGFEWDGAVVHQSARFDRYRAALERIAALGRTFRCTCSRRELSGATIYPGRCRARPVDPGAPAALRVRVDDVEVEFVDRIQGPQRQSLPTAVGDFVLMRRDGIASYALAVVVDDAEQGFTDIVRGADLLDNTPRQLYLYDVFGWPRPRHAHVPVLTDPHGNKLSKQTFAPPLEIDRASANLERVLNLLGQRSVEDLSGAPPAEILHAAMAEWRIASVPRVAKLQHNSRDVE